MLDIIIFCVIIVAVFAVLMHVKTPSPQAPTKIEYIRCPTCGAQAKVRGDVWECPWCADCGRINRKK